VLPGGKYCVLQTHLHKEQTAEVNYSEEQQKEQGHNQGKLHYGLPLHQSELAPFVFYILCGTKRFADSHCWLLPGTISPVPAAAYDFQVLEHA